MQTVNRDEITDLEDIPNVGPAIAANLRLIGVQSPEDLLGKDPYTMYDDLCDTTGVRHDLCVIDVFTAAVRFMAGEHPHVTSDVSTEFDLGFIPADCVARTQL